MNSLELDFSKKIEKRLLGGFAIVLLLVGNGACTTDAPQVFPQLGIDGAPVRWEEQTVVLSVLRPKTNELKINHSKLVQLVADAAKTFDTQLGVRFDVQKVQGTAFETSENGINEVVLTTYAKCTPNPLQGTPECNEEDNYGNTRVFPAKKVKGNTYRTIVEADIELNIDEIKNLPSKDIPSHITSIVRHELGHVLGLAHNCAASKWHQQRYKGKNKPPICDPTDKAQTSALMYPSPDYWILESPVYSL